MDAEIGFDLVFWCACRQVLSGRVPRELTVLVDTNLMRSNSFHADTTKHQCRPEYHFAYVDDGTICSQVSVMRSSKADEARVCQSPLNRQTGVRTSISLVSELLRHTEAADTTFYRIPIH
jgi:hypothetical protein